MQRIISMVIAVFILAVFAGCSDSASNPNTQSPTTLNTELSASGLARTWGAVSPANNDQMTISSNGTETDTLCASSGTVTSITPQPLTSCPNNGGTAITCGTATVNVVSNNGTNGCLPVGTSTCVYVTWSGVNAVELTFNCGGTSQTFQGLSSPASSAPTPPTFSSGDTEIWTPVNTPTLETFIGSTLISPTNYLVNIPIDPQDGGTITLQFTDGLNIYNIPFSNNDGGTENQLIGSTHRIYFEDPSGALILTISPQSGSAASTGDIYFMNFNTSAPNPLYSGLGLYCWTITQGPYSCINNNIPPTTPFVVSTNPSTITTFTLLGTIPTINAGTL